MAKQKQVVYCKPKLLRRISAAVIDFLIVVIIGVLISFVFTPIFKHSSVYMENLKIYQSYAVQSGLYRYTDEKQNEIIEVIATREDFIKNFYYQHVENGKEIYDQKKIESNLYDYDEISDTFTLKENVTESETIEFYVQMRDLAIAQYFNEYMYGNKVSAAAAYKLAAFNYLEFFICAAIGLIVVYVLLPLFFKDGKSVGKMLFKLKIISSKGSIQVSKLQLIFRGLVIIFFEMVISIYTMSIFYLPLTLLVSLVMMFVNKKQLTFHDLVCSTIVVDDASYDQIKESEKIILTIVEE